MANLSDMRAIYCRADRCWRSNNLRLCLQICDDLTRIFGESTPKDEASNELNQLKNLVWFLKVKCLSEDYYVNESLLLSEDDFVSDDQVRTFTSTGRQNVALRSMTAHSATPSRGGDTTGRRKMTGGMRMDTTRGQQRTGMITGRIPTRSSTSRQSGGRATSSYRPLTTSLTATQTAFSRSTRPLLRYSICHYLSKPIYEYLYNAQKITNKCPDYRQCLEYLNLASSSRRITANASGQTQAKVQSNKDKTTGGQLMHLSDDITQLDSDKDKHLGAFWALSYGVCYFNLKMHKQTEEYFLLALDIEPKCLDPYLWLIKVYLRLNQPLKVLKTCDDGLKNSRSAILYNWKARVQSLLNETYSAHLSLRESLSYYPTNIEALANVGYYSFYGDKLELSLKCFERINQLSLNTASGLVAGGDPSVSMQHQSSTAELFNNLALANFYCGYYSKVMPLYQRAFMNSPNKEVTSNIWYNLSFVPLSLGSRELAIACLRLALKNDSQNEDAMNNLGVLKYGHFINDPLHYANRQEYWSATSSTSKSSTELENRDDQRRQQALFDEAETFFSAVQATRLRKLSASEEDELDEPMPVECKPEMLFNMAIIKRKRGHLMSSVRYCRMYLENDQNNHSIRGILDEIRELVIHDS